jgi:ribose-phosphate pyrophosphokinase
MQVIFSTTEYASFAAYFLIQLPGAIAGEIERKPFPDGETGLRLITPVNGHDVVFVAASWNNDSTLEIFDLCCAIAKYGARSLTLIIPYFGCSTMERATKEGEVVTAKTRARLFSAIPKTHAGNRVLLLDLHTEGIPHYFEGDITATHVYAKPVIHKAVETIAKQYYANGVATQCVLASTDAGRAKWVESLANDFGIPAAFIIKRRESGTKTKVLAVSADVKGKLVVLYDDMIRTGGSLIEAAKAYRAAGAAQVAVVATHGVLPGDAVARMVDSKLFGRIVVTDSHPMAMKLKGKGQVDVVGVAELFVPWLS